MAKYAITNSSGIAAQQALTTTYKTQIAVYGTAGNARRGKLYDLLFGTNGTPADQSVIYDISQSTGFTTTFTYGANGTPQRLDQADAAAATTTGINATAEGTYTSNSSLFQLAVNQRASYRWVAAPGSELVWPAASATGLGFRAMSPSGATVNVNATEMFEEQ